MKLVFIGLDGLGLEQAGELAAAGVMPNLGRLMELAGAWGTDSPLPEVSPVCWTTMFSGLGPGGHGVYGFAEAEPGSYAIRPADSGAVRCPRIWETAGLAGKQVAVLNVPLTYPAAPVNGTMVSGFVVPELSRAVHPPEMLARLEALGYRPEADLEAGRSDLAGLARDLEAVLATRLELFRETLDQPWDLWVGVITDSDRVNHFLWDALHDPAHALHHEARGLFGLMDEFLGQVWERFGPEVEAGRATLMVAADHAFGPIRSEVYLNQWLLAEGYLAIEGRPPAERILPRTSALALDPGRIHLHWRGRFPGGWLEPGPEAETLLERIRTGLLALRFRRVVRGEEGIRVVEEPVVAAVHLGRELYRGPWADRAPDLVAEAAPGYSLRGGLDKDGVFGLSHLTGTHRPHGALALMLPPPAHKPSDLAGLHGLMAGALGLDVSADLPNSRFFV